MQQFCSIRFFFFLVYSSNKKKSIPTFSRWKMVTFLPSFLLKNCLFLCLVKESLIYQPLFYFKFQRKKNGEMKGMGIPWLSFPAVFADLEAENNVHVLWEGQQLGGNYGQKTLNLQKEKKDNPQAKQKLGRLQSTFFSPLLVFFLFFSTHRIFHPPWFFQYGNHNFSNIVNHHNYDRTGKSI